MPRALAIVPFLLATLGGAAAQDPQGPSPEALAVEALPATLGGFRRTGPVVDFERRPGGAGLGASARYVPSSGERMIATVILYDGGQTRRPEGGGGPDVLQHLRAAGGDLNEMVRLGRYRAVEPQGGMEVGGGTDGSVRCSLFRIVQADGRATGDSVCMTVRNGRFVKVRLTVEDPPGPMGAGLIGSGLTSQVRDAQAVAPR